MIGYRILNKHTSFINRHKDQNKFETNNNVIYKILVIIAMLLMWVKPRGN